MSHLFCYFSLQLLLSFSSMRARLLCFVHNLPRTWKSAWQSGTSTPTCWVNEWMNESDSHIRLGGPAQCMCMNFLKTTWGLQKSYPNSTEFLHILHPTFPMSPHHIDQNQEIKLHEMLLTKVQNSLGWTRVCTNAVFLIQDLTWHSVIMSPRSPPVWVASSLSLSFTALTLWRLQVSYSVECPSICVDLMFSHN